MLCQQGVLSQQQLQRLRCRRGRTRRSWTRTWLWCWCSIGIRSIRSSSSSGGTTCGVATSGGGRRIYRSLSSQVHGRSPRKETRTVNRHKSGQCSVSWRCVCVCWCRDLFPFLAFCRRVLSVRWFVCLSIYNRAFPVWCSYQKEIPCLSIDCYWDFGERRPNQHRDSSVFPPDVEHSRFVALVGLASSTRN